MSRRSRHFTRLLGHTHLDFRGEALSITQHRGDQGRLLSSLPGSNITGKESLLVGTRPTLERKVALIEKWTSKGR